MVGLMRTKSAKVTQKILEAARRLFLEHGFADTSMEALAREAAVSKATVYSHFENKEALFSSLVGAFCEEVLGLFPPPREVDDVRQELIGFALRVHAKMLEPQKADWDRMLISQAKRFPRLTEIYYEMGPAKARKQMQEFLRLNAAAGKLEVDDPEFSAEMFFGMTLGTKLYRMLLFPHLPVPKADQTARLVDAFLEIHRP